MRIPFRRYPKVKTVLLLIAGALSTFLCIVYLAGAPFIDALNSRTADSIMAMAPARPASQQVIIVDIDERSLTRYGQWPWPRTVLARLFSSIAASGAVSIGLDMILAEPETSPRVCGTMSSDVSVPAGPTARLPAPDRLLAATFASGPYVLGYAFWFRNAGKSQRNCNLHPPGLLLVNLTEGDSPFATANGVTCNLPYFSNAATRSGFLNATPDADGILRRIPMLVRFGDDLYPSLTLAMLLQTGKVDQLEVSRRPASGRIDVFAGEKRVRLDDRGNLMLRFCRSSEEAPRVSASAILAGEIAASRLHNKIVLIGFSAAGLEPTYRTTTGLHLPVEIHAQAMENLLSGEQAIRTTSFLVWEAIFGMILAAGVAVAVAHLGPTYSAALCVTLIVTTWAGFTLLFLRTNYLFSPLLPTVLVPVNFAALSMAKAWLALADKQLQLEQVNLNLEQRVADTVVDLRAKDQLLIQQGRQAAMGEMLNNIAHQWRQPLNILALIVQELRMTYGTNEFNKDMLEASVAKAMEQIQHMSQTIEDFRNYFKPDKAKTQFKVRESIDKTLALAEANLKSMRIEVVVTIKQDTEITGYPNEYSQVLLNILLNSRDAFEASEAPGTRTIEIVVDKVDDICVVTIGDNAGGIPEEVIGKIFDPYFTTKGPDKGTGIGLYMAKSIIENNMNGKLTVRNTGTGAEFRIEV